MKTETDTQTTTEHKQGATETTPLDFFRKNTQLFFDTYHRQFDLGLGIYSQMVKSILQGPTKMVNRNQIEFLEKGMKSFFDHFSNTINTSKDFLQKGMIPDWFIQTGKTFTNNDSVNAILDVYWEQAKVAIEFNRQFLDTVAKDFSLSENEYKLLGKKLNENLLGTIERSEESLKNLVEQYRTATTNSLQNTETFTKNVNTHFDELAKANVLLWEEFKKVFSLKKIRLTAEAIQND